LVQAEAAAQTPSEAQGSSAEAEGVRIQQAAESVASAGLAMAKALTTLQSPTLPLPPALAAENLAIQDLEKALELLSPPPPSEEPKPGEEDSDQSPASDEGQAREESESGRDGQERSQEPDEEQAGEGVDDPSQLLQGVRDREAARRRDRDRQAQQRRSVAVEKDW
jgi:hypothetical protein